MKEGAYDYLPKPFRPDEVVLTLRKAEERERLRHTVASLRAQLDTGGPAVRAGGAQSAGMRAALDLVARGAQRQGDGFGARESGPRQEGHARALYPSGVP